MKLLVICSIFLLGTAAVALPEPQGEGDIENFVIPAGTPTRSIDVGNIMDPSKVKSTTPSILAFGVPQNQRFRCASRVYSDGEIFRALFRAGQQEVRYTQIGPQLYPHYYGNREELDIGGCNSKQTREWPAFVGSTYEGDPSPGADRIIYIYRDSRKNGKSVEFCGMVTHEGATIRNSFVGCPRV